MRKALLLLLVGFLFYGCNKCKKVDEWINDAPIVLKEYLEVKEEILSNQKLVIEYSNNGELFLSSTDTILNFNYSLPKWRRWLANGRGYISIADSIECFQYESTCYNWDNTSFSAYIYNGNYIKKYHSQVEIIDSLYLGNGWYAHVIHNKDNDSF